jgi:DNA-binding IclR family transcriptional regulator
VDVATDAVTPRRGRRRTREGLGSVRALDRGLALLEVLAEGRELQLSEVARRVGLPYSTTHRLLETLARRAFVAQSRDTGLYRIGIRAFEVGSGLTQDRLYEVAHPEMKALMEEFNETVNLAVLDGREAVFVRQVEGRHLVRMLAKPGARAALHCTAAGKALLSGLSDDEIAGLLGTEPLAAYTGNTRTSVADVVAEVRRVRARGYALDREER